MKPNSHKKAITDAPEYRDSCARSCWSCQQYKNVEGAWDKGICQKHDFETGGQYVCDDYARVEPQPMLVEVVSGAKSAFVSYGSEVKATDDGHISGYLVRFSGEADTDLSGDFFTKSTDFGTQVESPIYYHHGLDKTIGKRVLGSGSMKTDDVGVWIEAQLDIRDRYEKAVLKLAKSGKLGWSSGTAPHLIERKDAGKAREITRWPLGLDASLTPTPAEPRNVAELKSLEVTELEVPPEPETVAEDSNVAPVEKAEQNNESTTGNTEMTPEEIKSAVASILADREAEAKKEADEKAAFDAKVAEAVKSQLAPINEGLKAGAPGLNLKTKPGDDAFKAFGHYVRTGDAGGIRTGEAYEQHMKTDYHLITGTQYQGQEAVPTEVYAGIMERRNQLSVARAAGAMVIPAGSSAMNIPIEKADPQAFGIVTQDGTTGSTTLTQQPIDKLAATIYTFTYNIPVNENLIDDSVFGVEGWASRYVGRGLGLTENTYMLMGTGSSQPQGAAYASALGVTAASATALTAAEIVQLYYTIPSEYRDNMVAVMATATEGALRGLTVSTQFPFVGNGGANGGVGAGGVSNGGGWIVAPSCRVFNSSAMDAIAASKKPVLIGNFAAGFAIVERKGLTVLRDPYSEASQGNVNLWFRARWSSGIVDAGAFRHILTPTG